MIDGMCLQDVKFFVSPEVRSICPVDDTHAANPLGDRYVNIKTAISPFDQRRTFGLLPLQEPALIILDGQMEAFTSIQDSQADGPIALPKREDPCIILDTRRGKGLDLPSKSLGRFAMSRDAPHGLLRQVRGQTKPCPQVMVDHRLHTHAVRDVRRNGLVGIRICLEIKPLQEKILRYIPGKAKDELTG
jgi:hypothetical protein